MELQEQFLHDWRASFPDIQPPNPLFLLSKNLVTARIAECEDNIYQAELTVRKEEFILNWLLGIDIDSLVVNDEVQGNANERSQANLKSTNSQPTATYGDPELKVVGMYPDTSNTNRDLVVGDHHTVPQDRLKPNDAFKHDLAPENQTVSEKGNDYSGGSGTTQHERSALPKQCDGQDEGAKVQETMSEISTKDVVRRRHSSDEKYNLQRQHRLNRFFSDRSPSRPAVNVNTGSGDLSETVDNLESGSKKYEIFDENPLLSMRARNVLPSTCEVDEHERQESSAVLSGNDKTKTEEKHSPRFNLSDGRLSGVTDLPKPVLRSENIADHSSDEVDIAVESDSLIPCDNYLDDDSADDVDGEEEEDVIYVNLQELRLGIHRRLRDRDGSDVSESGDSDTASQNELDLANHKDQKVLKGDESDDSTGEAIKSKDKEIDQDNEVNDILIATPDHLRYSSSDDGLSPKHPISQSSLSEHEVRIKYDENQSNHRKDDKGAKMRKYLAFNLLDSEKSYVDCLDMLCKYMKPLQKSTETSMPILTIADFNKIFFGIEEIFAVHKSFMLELEPRIEHWNDNQVVGDLLSGLMDNLPVYRQYVSNYKGAMETMLKCRNANETFDAIVKKEIKISSLKDSIKLDGLLYKPVDRITQYSLMLNDLLKYTSDDHPDHPLLIEVTATLFDLFETVSVDRSRKGVTQRQLLKEGYVVELVDGVRKPRQLFLFSDILMCAKLKPFKDEYNYKWYLSLVDLSLKPVNKVDLVQPVPVTVQADVDKLRASIANLRAELRREQLILAGAISSDGSPSMKRKNQSSFSTSSTRGGSNKNLEKLRKKLTEQENILSLVAPSLPWTIYHSNGKAYTLLLSSDEERQLWKEALGPRIRKMKARGETPAHLSHYEIQQALETCLKVQRLGARFGSVLPSPYIPTKSEKEDEEELLTGFLFVNIGGGKLFGRHDLYCLLEVDSYGHFFRKGKTRYSKGPEPNWDEDFEIEVEAARSLRLTCYSRLRLMGDDACGKVTINLVKENLGDFRHHSFTLSLDRQGVITVSVSFSTTQEGIQRTKSVSEGVFGVPVRVVTRREQFDIPLVVITCVKEVEKRGLKEIGIYRLSGVTSEVQFLKKSFDENPQSAVVAVAEADIHAVAGLLKTYFRELPEPLFTDKLYHKFIDGLQISEPEEKELYMLDLLEQLPRPNKMTALYLMEHLHRVHAMAEVNKMNLNNLATVFGPNVLRPSEENTEKSRKKSTAGFDIGALDVMSQVSIFRYFLTLKSERVKLPDDLDIWRRLDPKKAKELERELLETAEEYLI